jgi:hypothetical protein
MVIDRVRQLLCGLHGHDTMLQFGQERMFLRCVSCGHESPGWELADAPPPVDAGSRPPQAKALIQPQLVSARRVA